MYPSFIHPFHKRYFFLISLFYLLSPSSFAAEFHASNYQELLSQTSNLRPEVLEMALDSYHCGQSAHPTADKQILTIIDYSEPSTAKRFWVLDLKNKKVLFNTLVAHGKKSGGKLAHYFSNQPNSLATSLGVFRTGAIYQGQHGYSLQLHGLEKEFNDQAESRHIVIHSAWYVSESFAKTHDRVGASWGCPALDMKIAKPVIDTIKNGSLIFAYYPDQKWLAKSHYLHCSSQTV